MHLQGPTDDIPISKELKWVHRHEPPSKVKVAVAPFENGTTKVDIGNGVG
jgi:hypothetical protein